MFDNLQMPIGEAILRSVVGITTVIIILAVIAGLILLVSKVIRTFEEAVSKKKPAEATVTAPSVPAGVPMPAGMNQGELELINTDEKTAAVIMAIVSDKSGIPLNRLSFKSIKLMEDEK
jgi:Na+-transporting methylmalonyl-CoA/oxaloacetate decarboxylase gamma subunit